MVIAKLNSLIEEANEFEQSLEPLVIDSELRPIESDFHALWIAKGGELPIPNGLDCVWKTDGIERCTFNTLAEDTVYPLTLPSENMFRDTNDKGLRNIASSKHPDRDMYLIGETVIEPPYKYRHPITGLYDHYVLSQWHESNPDKFYYYLDSTNQLKEINIDGTGNTVLFTFPVTQVTWFVVDLGVVYYVRVNSFPFPNSIDFRKININGTGDTFIVNISSAPFGQFLTPTRFRYVRSENSIYWLDSRAVSSYIFHKINVTTNVDTILDMSSIRPIVMTSDVIRLIPARTTDDYIYFYIDTTIPEQSLSDTRLVRAHVDSITEYEPCEWLEKKRNIGGANGIGTDYFQDILWVDDETLVVVTGSSVDTTSWAVATMPNRFNTFSSGRLWRTSPYNSIHQDFELIASQFINQSGVTEFINIEIPQTHKDLMIQVTTLIDGTVANIDDMFISIGDLTGFMHRALQTDAGATVLVNSAGSVGVSSGLAVHHAMKTSETPNGNKFSLHTIFIPNYSRVCPKAAVILGGGMGFINTASGTVFNQMMGWVSTQDGIIDNIRFDVSLAASSGKFFEEGTRIKVYGMGIQAPEWDGGYSHGL